MSEAVSIKSRADDIMNEVMAEEESKYSQSAQSRRPSARSQTNQIGGGSDDSNEEDEDSDDEGHNVFYKADELIVSVTFNTINHSLFIQYQPRSVERNWLRKHGKSKYIDFDEEQMAILKDCFNDLDEDGSQAIGVDELEDPLIALGLVDSRKQVQQMVDAIDDDGEIEFNEFLKLVKGGGKTQAAMAEFMNDDDNGDADIIFNFFQKLTHGELQPSKEMKIGFGVYYSQERRKKILEAILGSQGKGENLAGRKILSNYRQ